MTVEEFNRIQAEAATHGQIAVIDAVITDQQPGIAGRLASRLFPRARPEAEAPGGAARSPQPEMELEI